MAFDVTSFIKATCLSIMNKDAKQYQIILVKQFSRQNMEVRVDYCIFWNNRVNDHILQIFCIRILITLTLLIKQVTNNQDYYAIQYTFSLIYLQDYVVQFKLYIHLIQIEVLMQSQASIQELRIKAFKVIVVGPQSVGKSSIILRLSQSIFAINYIPTIGIDFKTYNVQINQKMYSLQIWDTAGQQKFRALTSTYYKGSHGCVCVYDLQDKQSLQKCKYYIQKALEQNINRSCIYLLGNKCDLGEKDRQLGQQLAKTYQINFGITSAKNGQGLNLIFNNLTCKMIQNFGGDIKQTNLRLNPKIELRDQQQKCKC